MKKILFLTDMWSPKPTANSICVQNIADVLKQRGWKVYVNAFRGMPDQTSEIENDISIEYTKPSLARSLLTKAVYSSNPLAKMILNNIGVILNRITRIIFLPYYPIAAPMFARRWSEKIRQQVISNDIDIIVSVNAPFDSLQAGFLVKKNCPNVKWIAYYIDCGSNYGKEQTFLPVKKILQQKAAAWENEILAIADNIIIMEGHSKYYKSILSENNIDKMQILNVPLFNTSKMHSNIKKNTKSDKEIWTYMGSIRTGFYDPRKLIEWFKKYCESRNAELHIYGGTNMENVLQQECDNITIFYHGLIPHSQVDNVLKQSDILVYFSSEILDSVSGKFFEYLMYQKPIVYFGFKDDINWRQIEKYPLGIAIDQNTGEQTARLDILHADNSIISKELLVKNYYNSTPEAFADVICDL